MKTFEEKWTAWLDGQLSGRELAEFEASLPDQAAAESEKTEATKLRKLLKSEIGVQTLNNAEFFSHQLRERISRESGGGFPGAGARRRGKATPGGGSPVFWGGAHGAPASF